jgi:hypothetical protein
MTAGRSLLGSIPMQRCRWLPRSRPINHITSTMRGPWLMHLSSARRRNPHWDDAARNFPVGHAVCGAVALTRITAA